MSEQNQNQESSEPIIESSDEILDGAQEWLDIIETRPRLYFDPFVLLIGALAVPAIYYVFVTSMYEGWFWGFWYLLSMPFAAAVLNHRISRSRREAYEDQFALEADEHWIGRLIKALESSNRRSRGAAHRILPRLLTKLKASDVGLLDEPRKADLIYRLKLNRPRDMDLNLASIKALEQIGDDATLSVIRFAAETPVFLPSQRCVQRVARVAAARIETRLAARGRHSIAAEAVDETLNANVNSVNQRESIPEVEALKQRLKDEGEGRTSPGMRRSYLYGGVDNSVSRGAMANNIQYREQRVMAPRLFTASLIPVWESSSLDFVLSQKAGYCRTARLRPPSIRLKALARSRKRSSGRTQLSHSRPQNPWSGSYRN